MRLTDLDRVTVSVKCGWCTSKYKRPIFHEWPLLEIVEKARAGDVVGVCEPTNPRFVHWQVKSAA